MHAACVTSGSVQVLCKAAVAQPLSAALHKQGSSEMGNRQRWAHRRREALRGPEPPGGRHLQYTGRRLARQKSWRQGAPGAGQGAQSLKAAGLRQEQQRRKLANPPEHPAHLSAALQSPISSALTYPVHTGVSVHVYVCYK